MKGRNVRENSSSKQNIIVGRNSAIWSELSKDKTFSQSFQAVSHKDLGSFSFRQADRIWILSYSRKPEENEALLKAIRKGGAKEAVYISTATTNVVSLTACYEYPAVKLEAEKRARALLDARVLVIGVVYHAETELPAGTTMATRYDALKHFMAQPDWPRDTEQPALLFEAVGRPFGSIVERATFQAYGMAMAACRRWPCLLRPLDVLLRALGWRWYGYLFLSNRLWSSTIS